VIVPVFFWDFGPGSPPQGPGADVMIGTNCDWLKIYVGGRYLRTAVPDTLGFGGLAYPPVVTDIPVDCSRLPELRLDGYVAGRLAASVRMSADRSRDRLELTADDAAIMADGTDITRLTFRAVDAYGNQRPHVTGKVTLSLAGPATLIGDNPFPFGDYGGVGGAFVRSLPGLTGRVTVTARHPGLGEATVQLTVLPPGPDGSLA
jgi:beta-galactosidase